MEGRTEGAGCGGGGVFEGGIESLKDQTETACPVASFPGGLGDGEEGIEFLPGNEGFQSVSDHGGGACGVGIENDEDEAVEP